MWLAAFRGPSQHTGQGKDGGCDGWTAKPATKDDWLGETDTCWQLKAGAAGTPARLKGEVSKPIPKKTLADGGRFVVITSGSTAGKRGEEDRLKTLSDEASAASIPTDRIEVIGSERLAIWCNQNPAVAARWAGRPDGLWTLSDWSSAEIHQVPWQAPDTIKEEIARQRSSLEFETGSVHHLHIHGPPGVGKTRFALELCREAPWSASVIYLQQASDMRLVELIDGAVADAAIRLVVVADEIQPEQLRPLRDAVARANGRIRLVTVGHCPTPEPARIPALLMGPIEREMAAKVVKGWYPSMPTEHVDFVVRFADGYVRLARLAADAVARDTSLDVRGLLSRDEIRTFLDGMLGTGDRRALHVVAVLGSVGWTEDVQVEGEAIARHFSLDWNDVRAKVDEFHRRLGIVPRGGRYRYISPTPLGIHLAVEAWTTFPDLLRSLPDALPTEGAKDAYYERLRSMASNPQAREYAREELAFFFRLDDFIDARAVRRWSALSAADPNQAAANILRALEGTTPEERSRIGDRARRETVWTLVRLAWRPGAFFDATKALALLAEAENESWANNATAEFVGRFQILLGGTSVPYLDRLAVLDELVATDRAPIVHLVLQALARVGTRQAFRMGSEPASDELPEKEWQPSTGREHLECVLAALERLSKLASRGIAELEDDFITAANGLAMMLRDAPVRSAVAALFEAIRIQYPEAREPLRRAIADVVYRERKYWKKLPEKELTELDALHSGFEDASLPARLRQLVGQSRWERDEQPDLRPLARELAESPTTIVEMWPWLTSGDAADGWRLGEALAEEDTEGQLLDRVQSVEGAGRDLRVLCGYVSATRKRRGDEWYDGWVQAQSRRRPRALLLLFEIAWRCGATPTVAQCLHEVLQDEQVAPEIVGQLGFGRWGEDLAPGLLADLLRAMVDAGHEATALTILENRTESRPGEHDSWQALALELIAAPSLIRSGHMTSYYWKELALRYVDELPGEIAAAIIREQGDRSSGTWFAEHSEAVQVLQACVERSPEGVWYALQPQLSSRIGAYMFSIGFPRGVIERIPSDQVIAWVDAEPDERASVVAKLVSKNFSSDETLASRIVGTYGDRDDVASAFFSEYVSGSWSGPASSHWEHLAASVEEVANRTKLPKLRRWATDAARSLRQMAERDLQREEEEELRRR
ncbi:MAG: ATP-binding protein [Armatimonadetes bacterium]|nr:ATP-binding protein [Armatimonadota bacterium]